MKASRRRRPDGVARMAREKDETLTAPLKRMHGLGRLMGSRPAIDPPLDDVSHHEQIEEDKRRRAPAARF